jgi:hypothetical protein
MKFKLFRLLTLFAILGILGIPVLSQTITFDVKKWNGEVRQIEIGSLNKITFTNNELSLNYLNGNNENIETSSIQNIIFSTTTGANNPLADNDNLIIYPNPSTDFISLKNSPEIEVNIVLYTVSGSQLMSIQHYAGNDPIDIRHLAKGIYIIKVNNKALKFTKL